MTLLAAFIFPPFFFLLLSSPLKSCNIYVERETSQTGDLEAHFHLASISVLKLSRFEKSFSPTRLLFLLLQVVYRTRSMHSPTNCYLVSLAAADCVVLIASVPNEILSYYVIGSQWIWGPIGCAIFVFLQNLGTCVMMDTKIVYKRL